MDSVGERTGGGGVVWVMTGRSQIPVESVIRYDTGAAAVTTRQSCSSPMRCMQMPCTPTSLRPNGSASNAL